MDPTTEQHKELLPVPRPHSPARYRDAALTAYGSYLQDDGEDNQGGLFEYWRTLRRRKGTVILIAFAGLLLGIMITLPQTPIYQARASLEIQDINNEIVNLRSQSAAATEMGSNSNALADVQTQIKILQSESLAERTINSVNAKAKSPEPKAAQGRVSAWRQAFGLPQPPKPGPDQQVKAALSSLKARAAGQTRIIEITYDSSDPQYAADFLNSLTSEFIEQNVDARWKMMQRTGDWLTRQLDDVKVKLERSEDALQNYARQSGLVFTGGTSANGEKQNVTEEKLHQIQNSLSAAETDRVTKQSRYEMARSAPAESLPDVLNDASLRDYQLKLTDLRRQLAELTATYKPEYNKVQRIQAQIAPIESALERERQAILVRINNEYEEALRREKLLSANYTDQARLVTADAEKAIQYNILKREVDTNRQIYDSMLQRVKESTIASAMRASNIRIIDPAKAPRAPYRPNTTVNGALGALCGLIAGIGFVVARERADRTLQEPGETTLYLNIPELGVIPCANPSLQRAFNNFRGRASIDNSNDPIAQSDAKPSENATSSPGFTLAKSRSSNRENALTDDRIELVTWVRKPSMIAEAFRTVLTSLLFSSSNGNRPRVLVMTSAGPAEGKTTVACNVAIALAEIKNSTLIIDADLRKPRIHTLFGLDNERGLSDLLRPRKFEPDALAGMIRATAVPGLFALTAGPSTSAAANLLYSQNLKDLVSQCRKEFEMIIIDTPPMLQIPDARVVARNADAVILVARAHKTTRDAAIAARQRFADDGTHMLGTILNDWNPNTSPNGYYGYYSRTYSEHSRYYNPEEE